MKNTVLSFTIFILVFSCFIGLRVYAGSYYDNSSVTSSNASDIPVATTEDSSQSDNVNIEPTTIPSEDIEDSSPFHGDITPISTFTGKLPRIICWGDSLTESFDRKTAYPDVLRTLTGCEVINYGLSNELTTMIAMREGGIPVYVKSTVIPKSCDLIPVFLESETGNTVFFLEYGDGGVNPCKIGRIEGNLTKINGSYYFSRANVGERTSIEDGTLLSTKAMLDSKPDDVLILFTGTNDLPDTESIKNVIKLQCEMLNYASCNKYVVVGLTYASGIDEIDEVNDILSEEYGDHFLDIRDYLLSYGLEDAGLTATPEDLEDINAGEIPSSLRADYIHGNKYFYELLAKQLDRKLKYLGYIPNK